MRLKEAIERGLKEGIKRYKRHRGEKDILCAKNNMLIRAQLEAILQELLNQEETSCSKPPS